jgi:hypothetical protein
VTSGGPGIRLAALRKPKELPECLRDGRRGGSKEAGMLLPQGIGWSWRGAAPVPYWPDQWPTPRPRLAPGASVRPALAVASGGPAARSRAAGQGADPGRNGGFCPASLTHEEANGRPGCALSTGSARIRATDKPPVSLPRAGYHEKCRSPPRGTRPRSPVRQCLIIGGCCRHPRCLGMLQNEPSGAALVPNKPTEQPPISAGTRAQLL